MRASVAAAVGAVLLALPWAGCDRSGGVNTPAAAATSILALGDSYTIGEGVKENERWPVQLAERLRRQGVPAAAPVIIARTGWTIDELQAAVDRAAPKGPFALVTVLVGVNDQFRGRAAEACREPFRQLLARAVALAGGEPSRVLVLSIPDWGVTPYAAQAESGASPDPGPASEAAARSIGAAIDQFNRVQREETARAGAHYHEITGISREAKTNPALLAGDGLHPSGAMYARWVDVVLETAAKVLAK